MLWRASLLTAFLLATVGGCKGAPSLGESCKKDDECPSDAFCIDGHKGKKMCLQKCGPNALGTHTYPDCPSGWECSGVIDVRTESGQKAFAGLADDPVCVRPEWQESR